MRVLHLSTWDVPCGIATYCGNLVRALDALDIRSDVYPLQPHRWRTYTAGDVAELQADIARHALRYDLVHVQHEHGLFGHAVSYKAAARNFGAILRLVQDAGRPAVTTFHTAPLGASPTDGRFSLHETVRSWGRRIAWRRHVSGRFLARPAATAAVVHTPVTRRALIRRGIPATSVHIIPHGCLPPRDLRLDRLSAKSRLGLPPSTVVLTMFGFVGGYKGHDLAVRALAKLPARFHLAICGGAHPESDDRALANVIRLVRKLGLEQRVTITGWLSEAEAAIHYAATDICLCPPRARSRGHSPRAGPPSPARSPRSRRSAASSPAFCSPRQAWSTKSSGRRKSSRTTGPSPTASWPRPAGTSTHIPGRRRPPRPMLCTPA
jgi:glycosyltransferase involved in cell wall biosynthesis